MRDDAHAEPRDGDGFRPNLSASPPTRRLPPPWTARTGRGTRSCRRTIPARTDAPRASDASFCSCSVAPIIAVTSEATMTWGRWRRHGAAGPTSASAAGPPDPTHPDPASATVARRTRREEERVLAIFLFYNVRGIGGVQNRQGTRHDAAGVQGTDDKGNPIGTT